ncbi:acyltransferase family protein [Pseudoxanthomonas suwonensis]|uniref:acyltransferase family protein n=1 Tax=Pseudoxanthomonas suwonensis TaxID=314722 RepID=UPI0009DFB0B3|nr:acyltransferase [Pseudoxanthomonas suwonensis]
MTSPPPLARSSKLDSVQVLRALAAFAVVFHHVGLMLQTYHSPAMSNFSSALVSVGAAGVDIFFVISGFIIFLTTTKLPLGGRVARQFLLRRALRIYPAYWIWTSVLLVIWLSGLALKSHNYSIEYIVGSYFLVPVTREDGSIHPLLDQGWTLSFEMYFYLVVSVTLALGWRRGSPVAIVLLFLLLALASQTPVVPESLRSILSSPLVGEFVLGMVLGGLFVSGKLSAARPRALRMCLGLGAVLLWILAGLQDEVRGTGMDRFLAYGLPAALLVAFALVSQPPAWRLLPWLGDASYSIYLVHGFFTLGFGVALKMRLFSGAVPAELLLVGVSIAIFFLSSLAYRFVEQPVTRAVNSFNLATAPGRSLS